MRDILTERQWIFLARYAEGHKTTLIEIARRVLAAEPKKSNKFAQDQKRAAAAIGILERFLQNRNEPEYIRESVALELERMHHAYTDPKLLWTIYRRADKATGYDLPIRIEKRKAA